MTGGDALAQQLVREGIQHIFGVPGPTRVAAIQFDDLSVRVLPNHTCPSRNSQA